MGSRGMSTHARFEPCKADVSQRWEDAHSNWTRGLVRVWLRRGTPRSTLGDLRTSGVADPVMLELQYVQLACVRVALMPWCYAA